MDGTMHETAEDALNNVSFGRFNWPPNSPYLNPIENIWSILKKLIAAQNWTNDTLN